MVRDVVVLLRGTAAAGGRDGEARAVPVPAGPAGRYAPELADGAVP